MSVNACSLHPVSKCTHAHVCASMCRAKEEAIAGGRGQAVTAQVGGAFARLPEPRSADA